MEIEVRLKFQDVAEMTAYFASRETVCELEPVETTPPEPKAEEPPKKRGRGRPKKEDAEPKVEPQDEQKPDPTLDDVRAAVSALVATKGLPTAKRLLGEFDAGKVGDLPAEKYSDFLAACEKESA